MRRPFAFALVVGLATLAPPNAGAGPKDLAVEGSPLTEWVRRLGDKDHDKSFDAMGVLERARFLVGAAEVAVPALADAVGPEASRFPAVRVLGEFGPLARPALEALRTHAERYDGNYVDTNVLAALVLIGDGVPGHMATFRKEFARKDRTPRVNAFAAAGRVRLRGDFVCEALIAHERALERNEWLWTAEDLGPAASPLAGNLLDGLAQEKEPVLKGRALAALAWCSPLDAEQEKGIAKHLRTVQKAYLKSIVRGYASVAHVATDEVAAFLRARTTDSDATVAAWARAAAARMAPAATTHGSALLKDATNAAPEIRAAGFAGLLALRVRPGGTLAAARKGLDDPDLRVRWRSAAILRTEERTPGAEEEGAAERDARILEELGRAVDGPDDQERVLALAAVEGAGAAAAPLADRIRPWTTVPFPRIAEPARAALRAVESK